MQSEPSQICDFLSRYTITHKDSETMIIQSVSSSFLVKEVQVDSSQTDIDNIHQTLEQHQTLNQNYLLTLLNYNITAIPNSTFFTVRTIYQYAPLTLKEQIANRRADSSYFKEQEIWTIMFSVIKSLEYLQRYNIGYGVLGCDKIFIDKRIKLLDPSAVAEDPLALLPHKLYSPEVINQYSSINILKSDVFVLGLCLLQTILLIDLSASSTPHYDETKLNLYVKQVEQLYNPELANLIKQMLQYSPEDRPSFSDIQQYLQSSLQMYEQEPDDHFNPLPPDSQDKCNEIEPFDDMYQEQACDVEEQDERNSSIASLNEYEKAKLRFLTENNNALKEFSPSNEDSRYSTTVLNDDTRDMGKRKTSKYIKDKLVKKIDNLDLEVCQNRIVRGISHYVESSHSNLFTNPKLLEEIKKELKNIATARNQVASKQNLYSCNF